MFYPFQHFPVNMQVPISRDALKKFSVVSNQMRLFLPLSATIQTLLTFHSQNVLLFGTRLSTPGGKADGGMYQVGGCDVSQMVKHSLDRTISWTKVVSGVARRKNRHHFGPPSQTAARPLPSSASAEQADEDSSRCSPWFSSSCVLSLRRAMIMSPTKAVRSGHSTYRQVVDSDSNE